MQPHQRTGRSAVLTFGIAAVTLLAVAGAASAHVTVDPSTATQGGFATLTFRVPTEVDDASTVKVQVFFPASEPLASVSLRPHPGWSAKVTTRELAKPISGDDGTTSRAVSAITWAASSADTAIKPGEFEEFEISAGPLPRARSMEFKTLQTYSDGHVVRWIESTAAGGVEPEHPAPVLTLVPARAATPSTPETTAVSSSSSDHSTTALVVSIIALVVAVAGAGANLLRRSRS